jgi:hypothetical protein
MVWSRHPLETPSRIVAVAVNPDRCIFCGYRGPLTDEYVWGDWILKGGHAPRTTNKHEINLTFINLPGVPPKSKTKTRAGDPLGVNLHLVCANCNNGWMSGIQDRAKQHLVHMFPGKSWAIGADAQQAISAWAVMATMTSEYLAKDPSTRAISQADRDFLRSNLRSPESWRVWIGSYNRSTWKGQWVRTSASILDVANYPESGTAPPNTQTTTFIIGKLYVHVMSSFFPEHAALWDWRPTPRARALLVEIWPVKHGIIAWPRVALSDRDARLFSMSFFNAVSEIGRNTIR